MKNILSILQRLICLVALPLKKSKLVVLSLLFSFPVFANESPKDLISLTSHWVGFAALAIFIVAYILVILEEKIHLRKSKPVLLAAGLIWLLIAGVYQQMGDSHSAAVAIRHNFLEYAELFFFLLVAMTYINSMLERQVFDALRDQLIIKGYSYKSLFWLTGILAFFISPIADNLTTALIMCAVILAVGKDQPKFIAIGCVNIVVAANAGGAFSPFGDITTLMVWQKGLIEFTTFFKLFIPSMVNFLVPALIMQFALPSGKPEAISAEQTLIKKGGLVIVGLFLLTIVTAVCCHNFLHLPPVIGMMTGLAYLKFYGYYLREYSKTHIDKSDDPTEHEVEDDFDICLLYTSPSPRD